jgi:1,4-alpha-glucan branching enzyme
MLDGAEVAALLAAHHADPFAALGMHADATGKLWVRALLPGAESVELLDAASGKTLTNLLLRDDNAFFEARVPLRRKPFDYRLKVRWRNGRQGGLSEGTLLEGTYADAYAFGPQIDEADLAAFRDGREMRPQRFLGAHPRTIGGVDGVRFAVWAPNARRVSVVGDFNAWDGRRHPMRLRHTAGVWEIFVPHVAAGDLYKFEVFDAAGHLHVKADPYAFASEMRPSTASKVAAPQPLRALPAERAAANDRHAPISIYEVHASSWRQREDGGPHDSMRHDSMFLDWDALAAQLPDYAADLGFTHIELLPVSEHPFDGSWGYQTLGMFAPSARFGPVEGFARFVEACHARGLGVIVDWVPAHFPKDAHGLARFDGTALYEYADPKEGEHRDWGTLIYNFGRTEVRGFLTGSALHWIEQYGVDGLRVDAVASMLYRDYSRDSGEWVPNAHGGRENLEAISLMQQINTRVGGDTPGAMAIAEESTSFPGVSAPVFNGGLGFHFKWNMGWMNDTLRYIHEDPVHRRWHHDLMSFGLVYAFSENFILPISHDEVVHGKGSMLQKMPGDDWQRFANLRAYYGFMWGHPGKKLLFMGQEFAQSQEWRDGEPLPWWLLDASYQNAAPHQGVRDLIRDLNRLYRDTPALHRLDCDAAGFAWLSHDDREQSTLAWVRRDGHGGCALVVCNFTPVPRHGYRIGVPDDAGNAHRGNRWREAINTDSRHYGGSDLGNGDRMLEAEPVPAQGCARSLAITLPPLSTLILLPA